MTVHPIRKPAPVELTSGHGKNGPFSLVHRAVQLCSVQHEHSVEGSVANTLIPVNEGVVLDQRKAERRSLITESWVKILGVEGGRRLCQG
jgi:hypothetical protein